MTGIHALPAVPHVWLVTAEADLESGLYARLSECATLEIIGRSASFSGIASLERRNLDVLVWDVKTTSNQHISFERRQPLLAMVETVEQVSRVLRADALGVLEWGAQPQRLEAAIHALIAGLFVVDDIYSRIIRAHDEPGSASLSDQITRRELDLLQLIAVGASTKEIADDLLTSTRAVQTQVNSLLQKLGASSRMEAVVRAARLGVLHV